MLSSIRSKNIRFPITRIGSHTAQMIQYFRQVYDKPGDNELEKVKVLELSSPSSSGVDIFGMEITKSVLPIISEEFQ